MIIKKGFGFLEYFGLNDIFWYNKKLNKWIEYNDILKIESSEEFFEDDNYDNSIRINSLKAAKRYVRNFYKKNNPNTDAIFCLLIINKKKHYCKYFFNKNGKVYNTVYIP